MYWASFGYCEIYWCTNIYHIISISQAFAIGIWARKCYLVSRNIIDSCLTICCIIDKPLVSLSTRHLEYADLNCNLIKIVLV